MTEINNNIQDIKKLSNVFLHIIQQDLRDCVLEYLKRTKTKESIFCKRVQISAIEYDSIVKCKFNGRLSKYVEIVVACGYAPILKVYTLPSK